MADSRPMWPVATQTPELPSPAQRAEVAVPAQVAAVVPVQAAAVVPVQAAVVVVPVQAAAEAPVQAVVVVPVQAAEEPLPRRRLGVSHRGLHATAAPCRPLPPVRNRSPTAKIESLWAHP